MARSRNTQGTARDQLKELMRKDPEAILELLLQTQAEESQTPTEIEATVFETMTEGQPRWSKSGQSLKYEGECVVDGIDEKVLVVAYIPEAYASESVIFTVAVEGTPATPANERPSAKAS